VLTLQTKDPRDFPGTTVEVTGGTRAYRDVQFRHAGTAGSGSWGYKVAGEFQDADEWSNRLRYGTGGIIPETAVGGEVDWTAKVWRTTAGVTRYLGDARIDFSAGIAETDGVGQTSVGRNQLVGWRYDFQQLRFTSPRWYATAYRTESDAGKSYAINRYSEFRFAPANAGRSDEEIRQMADWPSNGQIYAAEVQNNFRVAPLLNTKVIWGGQYRHDVVSSERQWLTDRLTGDDLGIDQWGVYGQTETPVTSMVTLLLAGRYDDHESYDPQFSPKVGVVVTPVEGQSFRATYNRAFKAPTTLQTSFYIPDFVGGVGVFGNTQGFEVRRVSDGFVLANYKPLVPEENQTYELGWKGVFDGRLFVDVTGYRSKYRDFLSPLSTIAFPALGSRAYVNGEPVLNESGAEQAVLTYFNLGTAKLVGVDAGIDFAVTPTFTLSSTFSWAELRDIDEIDIRNVLGAPDTARIREASVLNAPELKWTVGGRVTNWHGVNAGLTVRHVDDYFFASGINKGVIPTFTTVDLSLGWRVPGVRGALINANLSNLFVCRGGDPRTTYADEESCGFGKKHAEMINMPELGAMLTVGVRYDLR
jgi:iron complex outermembrane receptor protein